MIESSFGNWLKLRRVTLDLSQQELANQVGCSVVTIRKMESDERRPSKQLAELLGTSLQVPDTERTAFIAFARNQGDYRSSPTPSDSPWQANADAVQAPPRQLPKPMTSFIGRQAELDAIQAQLANPDCRLLTLLGPGGMGKTRLAIEAANAQIGQYRDGVFFVPLVGLSSVQYIVPKIAETLHFSFTGQAAPQAQLFNHLRDKSMLLVLDNFEHLMMPVENEATGGAELVAELMQWAPELNLLVTSRERLLLQGEWSYDLHGMHYPQPPLDAETYQAEDLAHIAEYSAVALFLNCARRVQANFVLDFANVAAILRICHAVEGHPLGIEFAATWVRTLSPAQIAAEIERDLNLLDTSMRDVEPRHRNLQVVFDHSWQLLSDEEQQVLMQLSVFQGSFTRAAAEAVAQTRLLVLAALINKSLLKQSGETERYELHELVRQVSLTKLRKEPELEEAVCHRHTHFYAAFLQRQEEELFTVRDMAALVAIEQDIDNIRLAWHRAIAARQTDVLLKLVTSVAIFIQNRAWYHEGIALLERAIAAVRTLSGEELLLGKLLMHQGLLTRRVDRFNEAQSLLEEGETHLQCAGSQSDLAHLYRQLGTAAVFRRDLHAAKQYFVDALTIYEQTKETAAFGLFYHGLGFALRNLGEQKQAEKHARKALSLVLQEGPYRALGIIYHGVGELSLQQGKYQAARRQFEEGIAVSRKMGLQDALLYLLMGIGCVMRDLGEHQAAQGYFREGLAIAQTVDALRLQTQFLAALAHMAIVQGELSQAEKLLQESQKIAESNGPDVIFWMHDWAKGELALACNEHEQASTYFQHVLVQAEVDRQADAMNWALQGLGYVAMAQGKFDDALALFVRALEIAWNMSAIPDVLASLVGLATVYAGHDKNLRAINYLNIIQHHSGCRWQTMEKATQLRREIQGKVSVASDEMAQAASEIPNLEQFVRSIVAA